MKKLLFASTALVMTAGMAAAQDAAIALTGSASLGVFGGDDTDLQFHTDIDVTFTMLGETDNGVAFGANIDLDESDGSNVGESSDELVISPGPDGIEGTADDETTFTIPGSQGASPAFASDTQGGEVIFIEANGVRLEMGDTDGAFDFAMAEIPLVGTLNDVEEHAGYTGNSGLDGTYDGQIARLQFGIAGFQVGLSVELDDDDDRNGDPVLGIGARYTYDFAGTAVTFGAGYQTVNDFTDLLDDEDESADIYGISASTALANGLAVGANYSRLDQGDVDTDFFNIGATFTTGAFTFGANYGIQDSNEGDSDGFGVAAAYDLGGGAVARIGYGSGESEELDAATNLFSGNRVDVYSAGVTLSF